jgi:type III restriction enzyme
LLRYGAIGKVDCHDRCKIIYKALVGGASVRVDDGAELGIEGSRELWHTLQSLGILNEKGDIQAGANVYTDDYTITLPEQFAAQTNAVIDTLRNYRIERHIKSEKNTFNNRLRREQLNSPEFQELWKRISAKTRYRVMFETDDLVREAVRRVKLHPDIEPVQIRFQSAAVHVERAGVEATPESQSHEEIRYRGLSRTCLRTCRSRPI